MDSVNNKVNNSNINISLAHQKNNCDVKMQREGAGDEKCISYSLPKSITFNVGTETSETSVFLRAPVESVESIFTHVATLKRKVNYLTEMYNDYVKLRQYVFKNKVSDNAVKKEVIQNLEADFLNGFVSQSS